MKAKQGYGHTLHGCCLLCNTPLALYHRVSGSYDCTYSIIPQNDALQHPFSSAAPHHSYSTLGIATLLDVIPALYFNTARPYFKHAIEHSIYRLSVS